jgi:hypothetical protein
VSDCPAITNSEINHERHEPHEQIAHNSPDFCLVYHHYCASGAFCPRLQDEKGVINLGSDTPPLCGGDFLFRLPFVLFVRFVVEFGTAAVRLGAIYFSG